ncbi:MAG: Calx-beta domain-containing protein [Cyanobacteria bacterium P01_F01_bin.150]
MESNTLFSQKLDRLPLGDLQDNPFQSDTLAPLQPRTSTRLMPVAFRDSKAGERNRRLTRAKDLKKREGSNAADTVTVRGNTRYKAFGGDDRITVRKSDNIVIGGGGDDFINAKKGRGDNLLKGGGGADELIGGGRNDLLVGGGGADLLVIADGKLNKGISIIKGFKGSDTIAIRNVKKADEFDDLNFKKQGKDTLIRVGKRDIALVQKTKPRALRKRADDFIFADVESPIIAEPPIITEPPISDPPITVLPPPDTPTFSIGDRPNLPEGDSGANEEFFVVSLNQSLTDTVTVDYTITPGSATLDNDFSAVTSGTLTFAPGDTSETIAVTILGDVFKEEDETFTVTLSNPSGGVTIVDTVANGTIIDDENALTKIQGNVYSQSAQNQETLESQLEVYTVSQDGFFIPDEAPADEKTGTFLGAIQNFRSVDGKLKVVRDDDDNSDNDDVVTENGFAVISDQQPLVLKETVFDIGNLEAKLVYNTPLFGNRTVIEYTLYTGTGSDRTNIRTSVLDIDDLGDSSKPSDPFNDFPTRALPPNFDRNLAINSLEYIVENHLLGLTVPLLDPEDDGIFEPGAVDIILQDTFEKDLNIVGQKRQGNRYSRTGQDEQVRIDILFNLENVDSVDQFIEDDLPNDSNIGLFLGAAKDLEDPTGGSFLQDDITGEVILDGDGNPVLDPANPITSTALISTEGNLDAKLIEGRFDFDDRDVIQYTVFTGQGASRVDQFVAILDFNDVDGFGSFPFKSLPQPFDLDQAINSLTYIIENDLLSLTEAVNEGLSEVLALEEIDV